MNRGWMMGIALVCASASAWATTPAATKAPLSSWKSFAFTINASGSGLGHVSWQGEAWPNSDFRLAVAKGDSERGMVLMLGGRAMAIHGLKVRAGSELDVVDQAVLILRLVQTTLDRAYPGGPPALQETRKINLKEDKQPLEISTTSAGLSIPAPWRASGSLKRSAPSVVAFDLDINGDAVGAPVAMHLDGTLGALDSAPALEDAFRFRTGASTSSGHERQNRERRPPSTTALLPRRAHSRPWGISGR